MCRGVSLDHSFKIFVSLFKCFQSLLNGLTSNLNLQISISKAGIFIYLFINLCFGILSKYHAVKSHSNSESMCNVV